VPPQLNRSRNCKNLEIAPAHTVAIKLVEECLSYQSAASSPYFLPILNITDATRRE
jgi:hypothetical protein